MKLLKKICKELGVEVGEKWKSVDGNEYCILSNGMIQANGQDFGYQYWGDIFDGLIKPIGKPAIGDKYFTPDLSNLDKSKRYDWYNNGIDRLLYKRGLVFETKEEAVRAANKMIKVIKGGKIYESIENGV